MLVAKRSDSEFAAARVLLITVISSSKVTASKMEALKPKYNNKTIKYGTLVISNFLKSTVRKNQRHKGRRTIKLTAISLLKSANKKLVTLNHKYFILLKSKYFIA